MNFGRYKRIILPYILGQVNRQKNIEKTIENMLENACSFSAIANFVGMTTDSRSFMSFVRHDYFRRILCSFFAEKYDSGEIFCSIENLTEIIIKICYKNAEEIIRGSKNV